MTSSGLSPSYPSCRGWLYAVPVSLPPNELVALLVAVSFAAGLNVYATIATLGLLGHPGALLTAIRIPSTWAGARFYFEKVRDRNVWDFPLMNVASAMVLSGDTIQRARIAVNGAAVSCKLFRCWRNTRTGTNPM